MIAHEAASLVGAGTIAGVVIALSAARLLSQILPATTSLDPSTVAACSGMILVLTIPGSLRPRDPRLSCRSVSRSAARLKPSTSCLPIASHCLVAALEWPTMKAANGVYFRREDYAPFWLRVLVDVIDLLVFLALCVAFAIPIVAISPANRTTFNLLLTTFAAVAFSYFVLLKRSSYRTLGYRLARLKIVGIDGQPPSYPALILRTMFGFLGPLNWLLDLAWISNDTNRQSLRDKFTDTYVVKMAAQAAGHGRIVVRHYHILSYNFMFREVEAQLASAK
jgi:uncharacterized RDD family membrane protein YckC